MPIQLEELMSVLEQSTGILQSESAKYRPYGVDQTPGGVILLKPDLTTCIVPDLHARQDFLLKLLKYEYRGKKILERLQDSEIQIVCVGDGMHGESRVAQRWRNAYQEYKDGFQNCPEMAAEMNENFGTMFKIMQLKNKYPSGFHYLKGNHDNILDEDGNGNHPFAKFAAEGPMTKQYILKFLGESFLNQWAIFEKSLPLLALGSNYVISHSRPKFYFKIDQVINYKNNPDIIEGLTWTRDQAAISGVCRKMLNELLDSAFGEKYWFSGHTALTEQYKYWKDEGLVQIHHPDLQSVVLIENGVCLDVKSAFKMVG